MCVVSGGAGGLVDPTLVRVTDLSRTLGDNLAMRVRKKLRQDYFYPLGDAVSQKTKKAKPVKLWNIPCVHTLPTGSRRQAVPKQQIQSKEATARLSEETEVTTEVTLCTTDASSVDSSMSDHSERDSEDSVNVRPSGGGFRACDLSFGNACFATGTMGLVIASVVVSAIAMNDLPVPRSKLLIRNPLPKDAVAAPAIPLTSVRRPPSTPEPASDSADESECMCGGPKVENKLISSRFCVPVRQYPSTTGAETTTNSSFSATDMSPQSPAASSNPSVQLPTGIQPSSTGFTSLGSRLSLSVIDFERIFPVSEIPLIDSHCHLQLGQLYDTASNAVALAQRVGVKHLVVCGTAPGDDWSRVQQLAQTYPGYVRANYGLHPWRVGEHARSSEQPATGGVVRPTQSWLPQVLETLASLLRADPNAGVGECGLDKGVRRDAPLDVQAEVLHAHFQLASQYERSITLHCVGAWGRLYDIVIEHCRPSEQSVAQTMTHDLISSQSYGSGRRSNRVKSVVLHCCNSMPIEFVPLFAALPEVYFSLTMKSFSEKERALCRAIPLTKLLLETDSPDQLPSEFRQPRSRQDGGVACRTDSTTADSSSSSSSAQTHTDAAAGVSIGSANPPHVPISPSTPPMLEYNQPALLYHGAQKVAQILNIEYAQLASITYENSLRAYFT